MQVADRATHINIVSYKKLAFTGPVTGTTCSIASHANLCTTKKSRVLQERGRYIKGFQRNRAKRYGPRPQFMMA